MRTIDCRERAAECVALARKANSQGARTMLLHIAGVWLRLADAESGARHVPPEHMNPTLH
jgi:hypothetical protein